MTGKSLLGVFSTLLLFCGSVQSQPSPQRRVVCSDCEPWTMVPISADSIVVITGSTPSYKPRRTTNGGESWEVGAHMFPVAIKGGYHSYDILHDGTIFLHPKDVTYKSTDGGLQWENVSFIEDRAAVNFFTKDSAIGVIREPGKTLLDGRLSYDGGFFFLDEAFKYDWTAAVQGMAYRDMIVDHPERIMLLLGNTASGSFAISRNGGNDWTVSTVGTSHPTRQFTTPILAPSLMRERLYVVGGYVDTSDFFFSTNEGQSWSHGSSRAPSRVYRIAETAADQLWMLVGQHKVESSIDDLYGLFIGDGKKADTLLFSSDQGKSWTVAGDFAGHVVVELLPDEDGNMHVLSSLNGSVYHTIFRSSSSVERVGPESIRSLKIHPNPVSTEFRFSLPLNKDARITLSDVLGRTVFSGSLKLEKDKVERIVLPSELDGYKGLLHLRIEYASGFAGQSFVKL